MVESMGGLDIYNWTSHSVYMGKRKREWCETEEVLSNFGRTEQEARKEYRKYIKAGVETEEPIDFEGGGLIRSLGGYWESAKAIGKKGRRKESADERILGSGKFVEEILKHTEEQEKEQSRLQREGWDFERTMQRAAQAVGVEPEELNYRGRSDNRSRGRSLLCKWLVEDLGMTQRDVGEKLGVKRAAVGHMVKKGRSIEKEMGILLSG